MTGSIGVPLAAGLLSSVLFLSLAKGFAAGMLLSYLAPLPLMMAGLSRGSGAALAAGLAATAAVALAAGILSSLPYVLTAVLPSLAVVRQSLLWRTNAKGDVEWYPPGLALGWLTGLGVALMLFGVAFIPGQTDGGEGVGIQDWVRQAIGQTVAVLVPELSGEARQGAVDRWAAFFPAMVAGSWLVMAVVNAASAQGILARLGQNRRPTPAYRELELPVWLGGALVLAAAAGGLAEGDLGYLARNVAALILTPFVLLGLAQAHGWVARRPNARTLLAVMYGVLFLASAWVILPVAGLGLAKFLTRFRRPADSGGGKEE